jgi:hypothetical protein
MLEATGRCPFRETCETHRDLARIQGKLYIERRKSLSETSSIERVEIDEVMGDYQRKLMRLRRIEERCSSYYGRCLRFWQMDRLENGDELRGQIDHVWVAKVKHV